MKEYSYTCKSNDKNIKDKNYVLFNYAKQYALKYKTDIYDNATETLHYTYNDLKKEVVDATKETVNEIKDLHEEIKKDTTDELEKECDKIKEIFKEDTEYISDKADEGINYAEKKTNKFFNIIRKFINKIKSIFIK